MDITTDDLNRIFGKNEDSEDDFQVDPPQMADEHDLMEEELKDSWSRKTKIRPRRQTYALKSSRSG